MFTCHHLSWWLLGKTFRRNKDKPKIFKITWLVSTCVYSNVVAYRLYGMINSDRVLQTAVNQQYRLICFEIVYIYNFFFSTKQFLVSRLAQVSALSANKSWELICAPCSSQTYAKISSFHLPQGKVRSVTCITSTLQWKPLTRPVRMFLRTEWDLLDWWQTTKALIQMAREVCTED